MILVLLDETEVPDAVASLAPRARRDELAADEQGRLYCRQPTGHWSLVWSGRLDRLASLWAEAA